MDTKQVPFAAHNKVQIDANDGVFLPDETHLKNHLAGVHAGAQFLLAESASGYYLMTQFPQFSGRLVPLLRQATIKYCQQAVGELSSRVIVDDENVEKYISALTSRGRAVIDVDVEVLDEAGDVTCHASFRWFVQIQPAN